MEITTNDRRDETQMQHLFRSLAAGLKYRRNQFTVEGLTFKQLYDRMEILGERIISDTIKGSAICLCTEDRGCIAAALLAALRTGTHLLFPHEFSVETLEEARQRIPFTHALIEKEYALPNSVKRIQWPLSTPPSNHHPATTCISLDSTWLYLFTGGSTGTPQVWSKTPLNLLMEAVYLKNTFEITEDDTILATVPPNHIYGLLYSILLPLVTGAKVSLNTPTFPNEIVQRVEETNATVLVSIPAHYRALKDIPFDRHQVRLAFSSAGALAEEDSLGFHNNTGIAVTEIYGSTETGGIAQRNRANGQTTLIPFDCVDVRIKKNAHLQVRSDFLSEELIKSDDHYFETADQAQWSDAQGFILMGRSDGIVKVGGKRVDLAKTREILIQINGVEDVYVFAIPVQSGRENEIVALVEGRVSADQINRAVNLHLPSYARPRSIKITERIPLSSTGKYNRTAIKKLFDTNN